MGYNTVLFLLNDAAGGLTKPEAGSAILDAMGDSQRPEYRAEGKHFPLGSYGSGGTVLCSQHADDVQIVAVGGNCIIPLGVQWGAWAKMREPVELLRGLADDMGYRLVKKATR